MGWTPTLSARTSAGIATPARTHQKSTALTTAKRKPTQFGALIPNRRRRGQRTPQGRQAANPAGDIEHERDDAKHNNRTNRASNLTGDTLAPIIPISKSRSATISQIYTQKNRKRRKTQAINN